MQKLQAPKREVVLKMSNAPNVTGFLRAQVDTLEQVTYISPNVLVLVCDGSVLTRVCSL